MTSDNGIHIESVRTRKESPSAALSVVRRRKLNHAQHVDLDYHAERAFETFIFENNLDYLYYFEHDSKAFPDPETLKKIEDFEMKASTLCLLSDDHETFFYTQGVDAVFVDINKVKAGFTVATHGFDPKLAAKIYDKFSKVWTKTNPENQHKLKIKFWNLGEGGGQSRTRDLLVPKWDDVRANYPAVRENIETLISPDFKPGEGGKLILWYGAPGCGKTYAIRALGWEWREWLTTEYITDPERFFQGPAGYMLDVILQGKYEAETDKWRLLVLEDAGELLSLDAKERNGQGLSRLLNTVDGLLGQGLKLLFLITTNEPLSKIHPAVGRPGRAVHTLEFKSFTEEEARNWLNENEIEKVPDKKGDMTLAELYAYKAGQTFTSSNNRRNSFGFSSG